MDTSKIFSLFTDGGARGNPGPAGIGAVLYDPQQNILQQLSRFIGIATNNQAEYQALRMGLTAAKEHGIQHLRCSLDSELLVRQMQGVYRVKDEQLKILFLEVKKLVAEFVSITFQHVPRSQNSVADSLVNEAIDAALKNKRQMVQES